MAKHMHVISNSPPVSEMLTTPCFVTHRFWLGREAGQPRWAGNTDSVGARRRTGGAAVGRQRCGDAGMQGCGDAGMQHPRSQERFPRSNPAGERQREGEARAPSVLLGKLNLPVPPACKEICVTASAPLQRQPQGVFITANQRGCPI